MKYYETATIAQTQKRLKEEGHNISVCTLRGWVRTGVLPVARTGKKVLVYYPNVIKILREGTPHAS